MRERDHCEIMAGNLLFVEVIAEEKGKGPE